MKAVQEDRFPGIRTTIPKPLQVGTTERPSRPSVLFPGPFLSPHPPLQYPVQGNAFELQKALVRMFFGVSLKDQLWGLLGVLASLVGKPGKGKSGEKSA